MQSAKKQFKKSVAVSLLMLFVFFSVTFLCTTHNVFAEEAPPVKDTQEQTIDNAKADVMKFGMIAAAVAFGFGAIGAGIAIAHVGAAAMGAIGEKPEIAGQALIFIALAEGLVVFGFITALMILGRI
jgi:V/A-type H+-transporting ATPase subunit K